MAKLHRGVLELSDSALTPRRGRPGCAQGGATAGQWRSVPERVVAERLRAAAVRPIAWKSRIVTSLCAVVGIAALAGPAKAAPTTLADELAGLRHQLASERADDRDAAISTLSHVDAQNVDGILARISALETVIGLDPMNDALRAFREATGSTSADDRADLAAGIAPVLEKQRTPALLQTAELLLLMRSLEHARTLDAGKALTRVMFRNYAIWRWETMRVVWRMDVAAVPMLLRARSHPRARAREWAEWGLKELHIDEPGRAVQQPDARLLAEVLKTFGEMRDMQALTVVVPFVKDRRRTVREAARKATADYGRNAIWQLREVYRAVLGHDASLDWGLNTTQQRVYAAIDKQRIGKAQPLVSAGLANLEEGDLPAMKAKFEAALLASPETDLGEAMAPGFAALGAQALESGEYDEASQSFQRAIRLAPESELAGLWQARRLFAQAEAMRERGIFDQTLYQRALQSDPDLMSAADRLATLDVMPNVAAGRGPRRKSLLLFAALLLLVASGTLYMRRRREQLDALDLEGTLTDA